MSGDSPEEVQKHIKVYIAVFISLAVLTVLTVGAAQMHLASTKMAITLAMIIALVKGALVALFFMHLIKEAKVIYWTLALTVVFFVLLIFIPALFEGGAGTWGNLVRS